MNQQPYQQASHAIQEQAAAPGKALRTGVNIGASIYGGTAIAKMLPFLNKYIPSDLAIKGLSKVSPGLGKFFQQTNKQGFPIEETLDFVKEKIQPATEQKGILEQYSPELHQFVDQHVKGGKPLLEAAALAQADPKFKSIIKKIEKEHKTPFTSILQAIFGGEMGRQAGLGEFNKRQQGQPGIREQEMERFQGQYGQNQPQQGGPGQQALMGILQKLNKYRGGQ